MSGPEPTPLFVDTGAFYARADEDDKHHETVKRVFNGIRTGDPAYRPVYGKSRRKPRGSARG